MAKIYITGCPVARQAAAGYEGEIMDFTQADWSAKGFVNSGRLAMIYDQLTEGDLLLIRYGANDMDAGNAAAYAQPGDEFEDYLERFVNVARNKRATPVFLIPEIPNGEAWQESCITLAARLDVPCVQEGGGA